MRAAVAIESLKDNPYFAEKVKGIAHEVNYLPTRPDHDQLQLLLGEYDLLIIGARERITGDMVRQGPVRASVVGTLSVGTDHLDLPALAESGIHVERCPTANVQSVAEHALTLLLALSKHLKWGDRLAADGRPRTELPSLPFEVSGKTLGLIGYGNIGSTLGTLASAVGMQVVATSRSRQSGADGNVRFGTLRDVLEESHLLSVSVPLTDETRAFLNADTLADVRPGAVLVNTSRAEVVDEQAVRDALDSGRLAAYGGDYEHAAPDLVERPNVIVTPHVAGLTVESNDRLDNELIDRLVAHLKG
ncbi:NAD(P)-dependent oxidoreductase [Streptomyces sp. NPDC012510]|uniref:2-hydroxyacid dehydrogenase n=1 Tax=Streptomyces sp. NPDC012510 TaxID=3364838 RepID=UPI0036E0D14B